MAKRKQKRLHPVSRERGVQQVLDILTQHWKLRREAVPVQWALHAEAKRQWALQELQALREEAQAGEHPSLDEGRVRLCLERIGSLDGAVRDVIQTELQNQKTQVFLKHTKSLRSAVRAHVLAGKAFEPGTQESWDLLVCLETWRVTKLQAQELRRQEVAVQAVIRAERIKELQRTAKPRKGGGTYWEEPEPLPAATPRLEVVRERMETLETRVQQQEYRDTFGRGPQPRSQFRRFRN